jgi:GT2 family glycosyltransferase
MGAKISVVVPVYNGGRTLGEQLTALAEQDGINDAEVIIADNGSTDNTRAVIAEHAPLFRCLRVVDASTRRGGAAALNAGIAAASGECILLCDDDDHVQPGWLRGLLENSRDGLAVGAWVAITDDSPPAGNGVPGAGTLTPFLPYGLSANMGFPRALWQQLDGFDEALTTGYDLDFCWRTQLCGHSYVVAPDALIHKRQRSTTRAAWQQHVTYGESSVLLYRKHRKHGMRRKPVTILRRYAWLVTRSPLLWRADVKIVWVRLAAGCAGRLRGSLRLRTLYL